MNCVLISSTSSSTPAAACSIIGTFTHRGACVNHLSNVYTGVLCYTSSIVDVEDELIVSGAVTLVSSSLLLYDVAAGTLDNAVAVPV